MDGLAYIQMMMRNNVSEGLILRSEHARQDYIELVVKLYKRLLAWGWTKEYITPLIIEASEKIEKRSKHPQPTTSSGTIDDDDTRLFIHLQYHPDDISRRELRQIYKGTCGDIFFSKLDIVNPTIAYSRPPNIGVENSKGSVVCEKNVVVS